MKFHGTRNGLKVVDGRESDLLITAKFLGNDNQDKFGDYMAKVAAKLNEMEPYSDEMAEYLQAVEDKVSNAMIAEKFHDEVIFY